MSLQFNGTGDYAVTESSLSGLGDKITVGFWLYWDAYVNNDDLAIENGNSESFRSDPNGSGGTHELIMRSAIGGTLNGGTISRASAATWHHYVIVFDRTTGSGLGVTANVDGSSVTVTQTQSGTLGNNFANTHLYLMSRTGSSLFGAGRMAEVAIWSGSPLTGTDITNLYGNGPQGEASTAVKADTIQAGSLLHYWRLISGGTATIGGINMTLSGPIEASHPIAVGAVAPPEPAGSYAVSFSRPRFRAW